MHQAWIESGLFIKWVIYNADSCFIQEYKFKVNYNFDIFVQKSSRQITKESTQDM